MHKYNPEIRKEYKPDSYKKMPNLKVEPRDEAKKRSVDTDRLRDDPSKIEDFWSHMGLYDGKVLY